MKSSIDEGSSETNLKKANEGSNMSFGENLQFYRRNNYITQEQLAEKLDVSRQSISKWESNTTYPEMDKLLLMCDMFSCSLDTLLRGSAENLSGENTKEYDRHMNGFCRAITAGVGLLLLGVAVLLALLGVRVSGPVAVMGLMVFVIAAIMTFTTAGIGHDAFTKKHPNVKPSYTDEVIEKFDRKFAVLMPLSIGLLLLGVLWMVGSFAIPVPYGCERSLYAAGFLIILAVSVSIMTYAGMQKDKYDIEKYNQINSKEAKELAKTDDGDPLVGKICGSLLMLSLTVYLVLGFVWQMWSTAWIVFPIWIALCAISSILLTKRKKN